MSSLQSVFRYFSQPKVLRVLQAALAALLAVWIVSSLWRGVWSFLPPASPLPEITEINPVRGAAAPGAGIRVDIEKLVAAELFGAPGTELPAEQLAATDADVAAMSEAEAAQRLAGIEDGAPETRLPLLLRGVVASSDAGLGSAIIEEGKRQDLYQVGDKLPVSGEVTLAKVLPHLVVIDNQGRYETLRLFEEGGLTVQQTSAPSPAPAERSRRSMRAATDLPTASGTSSVSSSSQLEVAALAAEYRDRLYRDPQSLADVVRVSPAREDGELLGYRIVPGRSAREFNAMGFETGDVVTAVNGLSLQDPVNLPRLHTAMRSAESASFDIQRRGENLTLTVDIGRTASVNSQ